mmetsp:Transcript_3565/g.7773  ORF Transcript_3565/g.7773 Transcript_3565/m.7773 type:complete len:225 (-) Transcript_3565:1510-2184(-)
MGQTDQRLLPNAKEEEGSNDNVPHRAAPACARTGVPHQEESQKARQAVKWRGRFCSIRRLQQNQIQASSRVGEALVQHKRSHARNVTTEDLGAEPVCKQQQLRARRETLSEVERAPQEERVASAERNVEETGASEVDNGLVRADVRQGAHVPIPERLECLLSIVLVRLDRVEVFGEVNTLLVRDLCCGRQDLDFLVNPLQQLGKLFERQLAILVCITFSKRVLN